jgi:Protein of unknown function (DUF3465)
LNRLVLTVVLAIAGLIAAIVVLRLTQPGTSPIDTKKAAATGCRDVSRAFANHSSGNFLTVSARVSRLLPESVATRVHQRFIVSCPSHQTLLITNDISIGKRAPLSRGEHVIVRGQYVWDPQGGLIHFTHHDPAGGEGGWIYAAGQLYSLVHAGFPRNTTSSPIVS